jgi:hypothetical protein
MEKYSLKSCPRFTKKWRCAKAFAVKNLVFKVKLLAIFSFMISQNLLARPATSVGGVGGVGAVGAVAGVGGVGAVGAVAGVGGVGAVA